MGEDTLLVETLDLLLEASNLLKRQASERQLILKQIVKASSGKQEERISRNELVTELKDANDEDHPSKFYKMQKLALLNELFQELDHKLRHRDDLINEIDRLDANEQSRDELISILEEYCEMEEAAIYRMVSNYSEAQQILDASKKEGKLFQLLSEHDPRVKVLDIIRKRKEGMSLTQISFMLGISHYQLKKLLAELIDMGLVSRNNNLLRFNPPVELEEESSVLVH